MANFAELDLNNFVIRVVVVNDEDCIDEFGKESELIGIDFCKSILGGNWKQTSYNSSFRKNYAGVGFYYDEKRDAFIPPKPFNSWILDEDLCRWTPPVNMPKDSKTYLWNEEILNWEEVI